MLYTIRPASSGHGGFFVCADDPRDALRAAFELLDRGLKSVEICDAQGHVFDPAEFALAHLSTGAAVDSKAA